MEKEQIKFSAPQNFILTTTQRLNFFLSGIGAGKSFLIGVLSAYFSQNFPNTVGLIAANSHNQLNTATLVQVFEAWEKVLGWEVGVDYVVGIIPPPHFKRIRKFKSYSSVISFPNGAVIFTASLERYKLLDGKNLSYALIDEIKDAKPEAIKEVILPRLRQGGMYKDEDGQLTENEYTDADERREPFAPLYLFSSPSRETWLNEMFKLNDFEDEINDLTYNKEEFFAKEYEDKCVVISSSYHNEHLPKGFVDNQVETMTDRDSKQLIFANPFLATGGEYFPLWQRRIHRKTCKRIEGAPFHLSFDFNVNPYVTLLVSQLRVMDNGKVGIEVIDELLARPPRNRTVDVCNMFIKKYSHDARTSGVYIYGDASGKNSDTRGLNDFQIIEKTLREYINNRSFRVPAANPTIIHRRDFMNNMLDGIYSDEVEFSVDPRCIETIRDFENLKESADGKKDKTKVKDPITGMRIEKYGHIADSIEYLCVEVMQRLFRRHFK